MKDKYDFSPIGAEVNIIPVMQGESLPKVSEDELPDELPILALRNAALFPGTIYPITIGREKSIKLIRDAEEKNKYIVAIPQIDSSVDDPKKDDLYKYGTVAKIVKMLEMPDDTMTAILQGYSRFELKEIVTYEPYIIGRGKFLEDVEPKVDNNVKMLMESIKEKAATILKYSSFAPKEAASAMKSIDNLEFLVNFVATTIEVENIMDKVELLSISNVKSRGMKLLGVLDTQIELLKIKHEINQKVRSEIDQQQREYYLNNQLRTIQEELGMDDVEEFEKFRARAKEKGWSEEMQAAFEKEMAKMERYNPNSPEYSVQYNYIQFLLDLPWQNDKTEDNTDLKRAQRILDKDHFGLEKVKERILEYLAVIQRVGTAKSPILCLYGPPGVGKTSLGKSIARSMGRKYVRISLGGMHDESEIRGHRKTYVGALPGRILSAIMKAGSCNPVIVLDEVDKLDSEFRGDPASALLEVLDPEQNVSFHDNYLDMDYDLSEVLFITTANDISTLHPALRDRMEMLEVSGYLAEEKYEIAKHFLIPKQAEAHGLDKLIKIDKKTVIKIIDEYTRESGVRGLEKQIAKIARVTAKKLALGEEIPKSLKPENLKEYLGLPIGSHDKQKGNEAPGVVTGLAWTSVGGEILFIECSVSDGKGALSMTGNLGNVMKESAQIAYQYIKAHPELGETTSAAFAEKDIHIHVPEGAVPKDGPSAGITIVMAIISALRNKTIKSGVAMTGEMTLRGRVLPVGGIKEKILAAKRAGVKTIIISQDNRKDVEDIKAIYTEGLTFNYVKTIDDVIDLVF